MKLLMHTCCAPCSVYCIDTLRKEGIEPTIYWYNPNIHPYMEYKARRDTLKEYAKSLELNAIFDEDYGLDEFCKNVIGDLKNRCKNYCYPIRLRKTFEYAKENGYDAVTTTLLYSIYQNHDFIKDYMQKLSDEFGMSNIHMVMIKNGMSQKELSNMQKEIDKVDGVEWCLGMNSVIGSSIPSDMIPSSMKEMLQSDEYEMQFICSNYKSATEKVNKQINEINNIVKKYSPGSMVIGEAPLMNDLETVTNVDLRNVNIASIAAIFVIILIVFKSISLPVILVAVIEFAICVNMAVPYYTGLSLPFVASIVIGTIQLGATVDYAILMTSRYQKERINGKKKMEAIRIAHETSMQSIITSGLSFFAATIGIAIYSNINMISAICTLLARGAVISTVAVIFILPAMFMIFDKLICKTTLKMGHLE